MQCSLSPSEVTAAEGSKFGLVGWQLQDSDFFSYLRRERKKMKSSELVSSTLSVNYNLFVKVVLVSVL